MYMMKLSMNNLVEMTSFLVCGQCSVFGGCRLRGKVSPWLLTIILLDGISFPSSNIVPYKFSKLRIYPFYFAMNFKIDLHIFFSSFRSRPRSISLTPHQGGLDKTESTIASCWCGSDKAKCTEAELKNQEKAENKVEDKEGANDEYILRGEAYQIEVSNCFDMLNSIVRRSVRKLSEKFIHKTDFHVGVNKPCENNMLVSFRELVVFRVLPMAWAEDRIMSTQEELQWNFVTVHEEVETHVQEAAEHKLLLACGVLQWDSEACLCSTSNQNLSLQTDRIFPRLV